MFNFHNIIHSSSDIINVVRFAKFERCKANVRGRTPDPNIFLWTAASNADAAAVNPNGIETLLANSLSTFPIKGNLFFSNGTKGLPKNTPDCPVLCNWVFYNYILTEELFAKALQSFETCVLLNRNLCGKLFLSLESQTKVDEISKVTSVPFFIPDFNLISCELDNFTFKVLLSHIILKQK